ncbi:MAG: endolytic transglycosylase MltG [Thermoleophilia bacterium]
MAREARAGLHRSHRLATIAGFLVVLVVVALFAYRVYGAVFGEAGGEDTPGSGETVTVEVLPGLSAEDVAKLLERRGVIDSTWSFVARVRVEGAAEDIKPGTYEFRTGEDYGSIIAKLREGAQPELQRVTLPEGLSIDQTAERLTEMGLIDGERYRELATDPADFEPPVVGGEIPEVKTLEGLLFPDTYLLPLEADAALLIREQLAAFGAQTGSLPWENAEALGVTPYQVVIVASLIEKEARIADERPLVAAVVYNRLEKEMPLGIDATIRYALKKWTEPLTKSDLEVESPFNTRRSQGLPPTPIASPGLAALQAALEPADVDYLYYVLQDEDGHHFFTNSYEEFLEAKERQPGD